MEQEQFSIQQPIIKSNKKEQKIEQ